MHRWRRLVAAAILLSSAAPAALPTPPAARPAILFGTSYYDEYVPSGRLGTDMRLMKAAGINVIRIGESTWGTMEPQDGAFDFTHIDRVLDAAQAAGIGVIVGTPTYAVPPWLYRKYPAILAETVAGQNRYGARQNMDWTNPDFRRYAERAIRRLVAHVRDHPAVIGYQIDNETKEYGHVGANRVAGFRNYLQQRFGTLDRLNDALGLNFWSNRVGDWADLPSPAGTVNPSVDVVFRDYRRQLLVDYLGWQAGLVRALARPGQFVTHNFDMNNVWGDSNVDQVAVARLLDRAGVDIYFGAQEDFSGSQIALGGDMARSAKQGLPYLVLETQSRGMMSLASYPEQLRLEAFSHLASGASGVLYWQWNSMLNGAETYFRGILPHDFQPDEVYDQIAAIGRDLQRIGPELADLHKHNQVALYVSQRAMDGFNAFKFGWGTDQNWNDVWRPFYEALYRLNVEVDIVGPPTPAERLRGYKLVVVPALYAAEDAELDRLADYAQGGGHLLLTFKTGFADENAKVRPVRQPARLADAAGVTYNDFVLPHDLGLAGDPFKVGAADNKVRWWMELLEPHGADILARYDHPTWGRYAAVTRNHYGRGSVTYLGTMPSDAMLRALMQSTLHDAGVVRPAVAFPLVERGGTNGHGRAIHYLLNYSGEPRRYVYRGRSGVDLLTGRRIAEGPVPLAPWGVAVIEEAGPR